MKNWCKRCNRYHDAEPVDPSKIAEGHADALAKEIDQMVLASLHMSDKGYKLSTHEKQAEFERKRNGQK